jgi:hypothetical protein
MIFSTIFWKKKVSIFKSLARKIQEMATVVPWGPEGDTKDLHEYLTT